MLLIKCHSGDKIKTNVARMGDRRVACRVGYGNVRERDHLEDVGIDGMLIVKCFLRNRRGDLEWIGVAHDRDRWCALVNAEMNIQVPQCDGNLLTEGLLAFRE